MPRALKALWVLEWHTQRHAYQRDVGMMILFGILLFSSLFAFPHDRAFQTIALPGLLMMGLAVLVLFATQNLFSTDARTGYLDVIATHPEVSLLDLLWIKLFLCCCTLAPIVLFFGGGVCIFCLGYDWRILILVLGLCVHLMALISLCTMSSVFLLGHHSSGILSGILCFPLIIPLLIFAGLGYHEILEGTISLPASFRFLGVSFLAIPLGVAGSYIALRSHIEYRLEMNLDYETDAT